MVTTDSKHNLPVAENTLNQTFQASKPNEKWVTDMDLRQSLHLGPLMFGQAKAGYT